MKDARIGPYTLRRRLGAGAMGVVWLAHAPDGAPVALKLLDPKVAERVGSGVDDARAASVRRFQREVQAAARLRHPHIVEVLDHGVSTEEDRASGAPTAHGLPWLAMAVAGGSVASWALPSHWPAVRTLLHALLDALAHAHARGVVHRDIKPENVLLAADGTPLLADFGLAHALRPHRASARHHTDLVGAGTPLFMSPEQFAGHWRAFGPWTDLWALGAMTWALTTGRFPFHARSVAMLAVDVTGSPLPAYEPAVDVPAGLGGWLRWMLAKAPRDRFRCAADARDALAALEPDVAHEIVDRSAPRRAAGERAQSAPGGGPDAAPHVDSMAITGVFGDGTPSGNREPPERHTPARPLASGSVGDPRDLGSRDRETDDDAIALSRTHADALSNTRPLADAGASDALPTFADVALLTRHDEATPTLESPPSGARAERAAQAADTERTIDRRPSVAWRAWRRRAERPLAAPRSTALFGLREPVFIGREAARDALWDTLRAVHHDGRNRVALIRGASGHGKSALARWLVRTAHELGVAPARLRAEHGSGLGHHEALRRMLAVHLGVLGLTAAQAQAALLELAIAPELVDDLVSVVVAFDELPGVVGRRFVHDSHRFQVLLSSLQRLRQRAQDTRPVVVWLDDVQWGAESLGWMRHAVQNAEEGPPLCFVATVRDDALRERPFERALLADLITTSSDDAVREVSLGPLPHAQQVRLLSALAPMSTHFSRKLAALTSGDPLVAIQLVTHWVRHGDMLADGDAPGSSALGVSSPGASAPTRPHHQNHAEVLPALPARDELWRLRIQGVLDDHPLPKLALLALEVAAGIGVHVDTDLWFAASDHMAPPEQRWVVDRRLFDDLLTTLVGERLAERTVDGWFFAHGEVREWLVRRATTRGRWTFLSRGLAHVLAERAHSALSPMATMRVQERRAHHLIEAREYDAAATLLADLASLARTHTSSLLTATLLDRFEGIQEQLAPTDRRVFGAALTRVAWLIDRGEYADAERRVEQLIARARGAGDTATECQARREAGSLFLLRGDIDRARASFRLSIELARANHDDRALGMTLAYLAEVELTSGHIDDAHALAEESIAYLEPASLWNAVANSRRTLALVERARQRPDAARAHLERALELAGEHAMLTVRADLLNALADIERQAGNLDTALEHQRAVVAISDSLGIGTHILRFNLAMTELELGQTTPAAARFTEILGETEIREHGYILPFLHLAMACCAALEGAAESYDWHIERAQDGFDGSQLADPDGVALATRASAAWARLGDDARCNRARALAHEQRVRLGWSDRDAT